MPLKWSVGFKIAVGFGLALLAVLVISLLAYQETTAIIADVERVNHTHQTLGALDELLLRLVDIETGVRGYVITGANAFLEPYQAAQPRIDEAMRNLRALTTDHPNQAQRLDTLERLIAQRIEASQALITLRREQGFAVAAQNVADGSGKDLMDQVRAVMAEMTAEEQNRLSQDTERAQAAAQNALLTILIGAVAGFLVVGGGSLLLTRNITGLVRRLALGAEHIGAGQFDYRIPNITRDELGDLATAFNRMAERLAEAQTALQVVHAELELRVRQRTAELDRVNRALRTLSDCNQALVRAESEADLLNQICRLLVETGGYRMAWVGYAEQAEARTVRPMAHAGWLGEDQNVINRLTLSWAEAEGNPTPVETAIRTGQPSAARITTDRVDEAWRAQALQLGYTSYMAFPLVAVGQVFGALSLFASEPEAFDAAEVKLLTELADDLAYGLQTFRTRAAHQRAESALHESLEKYHRTLDQMLEGCQMIDFNWRYLYVNEAVARQGRRPSAELLGQTMMAVYPGIEATPLFAVLRRCMIERTTQHIENEFIYPDGGTSWFELSIQPVPEGIFVLSVDITERKRTEAQLRESQAQMAGVIGSAMDAIITVNDEQRITLFNAAAEKMFNLSSAEASGQTLDRFIPARFRETHREHIRHFGDTHLTMRQMGALNELAALRADGVEFPIEASISQTEIEGRKLFTVILRDITERQRAEAALRLREQHNLALLQLGKDLEQAQLPTEALGAALTQVKAVLGYQAIWAYLMAEDDSHLSLIAIQGDIAGRVGNEFSTLTVKGDPYLEEVMAATEAVLVEDAHTDPRTNKAIVAQMGNRTLLNAPMVLLERKLGALGTGSFGEEGVRVPTQAQLDFFSALTSHVAVTLDRIQLLNHLQTAQAELRQFNADLERRVADRTAQLEIANRELERAKGEAEQARASAETANQAKSEFLSRMSHELRTPLNAILGFAQILGMEAHHPNQQEGLQHILASGRHLLTLINEVLDIARIETGRMSLSPEPVLVNEVAREALDLIQPLAVQRNIQLLWGEIPDKYIRADHQRFKQVLLNLLSNAVKYNHPDGRVTVTSTALPEARPGATLRLEIIDTGPGIPAHKLGRLFTPFDRLDADEASVPGTGLGLALSKNLVEAMGGVIGVESIVSQGTTFWVEMPLVEAPKERLKRTGNLLSFSASPLTKAKTVLYVEDNLSNQQLVEQILAYRPTLRLITTMQGRLSVDLAREHQPALILLDLNLPDMHGSEVLDTLQADARTASIPVVVISADATSNQIERLLAAGARAYLTKPFDVKHFLQVLDGLLA